MRERKRERERERERESNLSHEHTYYQQGDRFGAAMGELKFCKAGARDQSPQVRGFLLVLNVKGAAAFYGAYTYSQQDDRWAPIIPNARPKILQPKIQNLPLLKV